MFEKLFTIKKIFAAVILIILSLVFVSNRPLTEEQFWNWFSENSDRYYKELVDVQKEDSPQQGSFSELGEQLRKVDKNLTYQFGLPDPKTKKAELVISSDGIKEGMPAVQKLVKSSPKFEKWTIVAFRQRTNDFGEIEFNGIKLSIEDIYFKDTPDGEKTGIDFFINGYDGVDERYIGATFILLDNHIGEYDVMTRIGFIEFHTLDETNMSGLKPLKELSKLIDSKK